MVYSSPGLFASRGLILKLMDPESRAGPPVCGRLENEGIVVSGRLEVEAVRRGV